MLDKKMADTVRKLKQNESVWVCALRVAIPSKDPSKAVQVFMVLDTDGMALRKMEMVVGVPNMDELADQLAKAMYAPQAGPSGLGGLMGPKLPKNRPTTVYFEDDQLFAAMSPVLTDLAISAQLSSHFEPLDEMMQMFAQFAGMSGLDFESLDDALPPMPDHRVALLDIPGVAEPLIRELFEHAANFFKTQPWENLEEEDIFAAKYGLPGQPQHEYVISMMGMGGMEFGLALFDSVADLNASLSFDDPENLDEVAKAVRSMSLTFVEKDELLPKDVAAQKKYRWALPNKKIFPLLFRYSPEEGMTTPTREDIGAISALLQVLPEFIDNHLMASEDDLENGLALHKNGADSSADNNSDNHQNADEADENAVQTFELSLVHAGAVLTVSYPVEGVEFPDIDLMGDVDWLLDDAGADDNS